MSIVASSATKIFGTTFKKLTARKMRLVLSRFQGIAQFHPRNNVQLQTQLMRIRNAEAQAVDEYMYVPGNSHLTHTVS